MRLPKKVILFLVASIGTSAFAQWSANHGVTATELGTLFGERTAAGYRPVDVSACTNAAGARFSVIWEKRNSPRYRFYYGMSASGLSSRMASQEAEGFRPVLTETYFEGSTQRFLGIWEKWIGGDTLFDQAIALSDWPATLATRKADGYRPLRIDRTATSLSVLWELRPLPEWQLATELPAAALTTEIELRAQAGFVPAKINGFGNTLSLLFEKKLPRPRVADAGLTNSEYQSTFATRTAAGFRPISLTCYDDAGTTRYAAIWEQADRPPLPSTYPVSGLPRAELTALDSAMNHFMRDRSISAGVLCVAKDDTILYERGFGWRDFAHTEPLRASAPMRVASLAKPVTAAAIHKLVNQGDLTLTDNVFDLGQSGGGILTITPFSTPDSRLKDITIQHLLDHKGGWDLTLSGDHTNRPLTIATALGVSLPPTQEQVIRWATGQPLDHTPGTTYAYANFGFLLLGEVIETITGTNTTEWIQENVIGETGFHRARTFPIDRDPREPTYYDPAFGSYNTSRPAEFAPWPDGAWDIEFRESLGGWAFTARTYTKFLTEYWISGIPRIGNGASYTFFGSQSGTRAVARQRPDGISYTAIFNQRADASGLSYTLIDDLLDAAIDTITTWPTMDPAETSAKIPSPRLEGATILWPGEEGRIYDVLQSGDLTTWSPQVVLGSAENSVLQFTIPESPARAFFRIGVE